MVPDSIRFVMSSARESSIDRQRLVQRASSLSELLATPPIAGSAHDPELDTFAARWLQTAARGDASDFRRRLTFLGLDPETAAAHLNPGNLESHEPPHWLRVLEDVGTDDTGRMSNQALARFGIPGFIETNPHILPSVLFGLMQVAVCRLNTAVPTGCTGFDGSSVADLLANLQRRLAVTLQTVVDTEFRSFQDKTEIAPQGSEQWKRWTDQLEGSRLFALWDSYPALARLVGTSILLWGQRSSELLVRATNDTAQLSETLGVELTSLAHVSVGMSDSHNGHASVSVCEFRDAVGTATRVVYKPKDMRSESIWAQLIDWMNSSGADVGPSLRVVAKCDYGWVEYADQCPVTSDSQARLYYHRAGVLAALLFAIGSNDCHAENVVARGAQPVVVDAETILQPILVSEDEPVAPFGPASEGGGRPTESVLDALFLPRWMNVGGTARDLSALGCGDPDAQPARMVLEWTGPETDSARLGRTTVPGLDRKNDIFDQDGNLLHCSTYVEELVAGFTQGWALLAQVGDQLLLPGAPLDQLATTPIRVLARMTMTYARLLQTSLDPMLLRSGLARSVQFEYLSRAVLDRRDSAQTLALVDDEREQMEVGDTPFFTALGSEPSLVGRDGTELARFYESALDRARYRLQLLTPDELARQLTLVRASCSVARWHTRELVTAEQSESAVSDRAPSTHDQPDYAPARSAITTLRDVITNCIEDKGGRARITGLTPASKRDWAIEPLNSSFYDGQSGVSFALFAAGQALDSIETTNTALALMRPVINDTTQRTQRALHSHGVGGQRGVGGILYAWALSYCSTANEQARSELHDACSELVGNLKPTDLELAKRSDLLSGSFGLLSGLMAADEIGVTIPGDLIDATVAHIASDLRTSWASQPVIERVCGYSHGDAGTAVLMAAADARGWSRPGTQMRDLAQQAVIDESSRFRPAIANWPDNREGTLDPDSGGPGWCNGLPGIVLSRTMLMSRFPTVAPDAVARDLSRSGSGLSIDRQPIDTLCCGMTGRVEVLRQALTNASVSDRLQSCDSIGPGWIAREYSDAVDRLSIRTLEGRLRLGIPRESPLTAPGLYSGIAGVLIALTGALTAPTTSTPSPLTWLLPQTALDTP